MLQNFTQITSNLVVDSFTYLIFLIFLILRIDNAVVRVIEDSSCVILLGKKNRVGKWTITDIQKRKRAIENYLHKADVRKWSQFNKPSSTDYEIVHCTVYPLNNETEYNNDYRYLSFQYFY